MSDIVKGSMETLSALQITEAMEHFDRAGKELLRHKEILAVILKDTVEEYKNYTAGEIMDFIEADSVKGAEVSRGRTNTVIRGEPTEFGDVNERMALFDILFRAKNPELSDERMTVNLHVDVEPQKNYRPGFPIEKRGIYYLARSLSVQLGLVTRESDYNALEMCCSIWICRDNIPEKERFTISRYKIMNYQNTGGVKPKRADYDLLRLVIIRLGSDQYSGPEDDLFRFLTALFYPHRHGVRETIERYIDFTQNEELKKEVAHMSGLGQSIYEEGIEEGIEKGIEKGVERGSEIHLICLTRKKAEKRIPVEQCAEMLESSPALIARLYEIFRCHPEWDDAAVYEAIAE